jgi:hypothetical protein
LVRSAGRGEIAVRKRHPRRGALRSGKIDKSRQLNIGARVDPRAGGREVAGRLEAHGRGPAVHAGRKPGRRGVANPAQQQAPFVKGQSPVAVRVRLEDDDARIQAHVQPKREPRPFSFDQRGLDNLAEGVGHARRRGEGGGQADQRDEQETHPGALAFMAPVWLRSDQANSPVSLDKSAPVGDSAKTPSLALRSLATGGPAPTNTRSDFCNQTTVVAL